ncbi:MAG: hypothetical protein ABI857_12130 [Acidobacteriota bacterium]
MMMMMMNAIQADNLGIDGTARFRLQFYHYVGIAPSLTELNQIEITETSLRGTDVANDPFAARIVLT